MKKLIVRGALLVAFVLAGNFALGYSKYSGVTERVGASCLSDGSPPAFCKCVQDKMRSSYLFDGASSYSPLSEMIVPENLSWTKSKFEGNSRLDCQWLRDG